MLSATKSLQLPLESFGKSSGFDGPYSVMALLSVGRIRGDRDL